MKKIVFIFFFILQLQEIHSKEYINLTNFDYVHTNKKCFIINSTTNDETNDFLSAMKLSKAIGEVAAAPIGNDQNIKSVNGIFNFKISRVKFVKPNLSSLLDNFMDELKLIIIEPQNNIQNNKPCVLVTCGGGNMNDAHRAFYLGLTEYVMKGYVVAYYENPDAKFRVKEQAVYLLSELPEKSCYPNNCSPEILRKFYDMSLYLGVQTAQAAVNFMAANKSTYNIDVNNFYASGQSYGGFCTISLGLGSKRNYYNESGTLTVPFNLLGIPTKYAVSRNDYTLKAISPWSGNYPTVDNIATHTNPFGEFIDNIQNHIEKNGDYIDKPDAKVLHFHGQLDIEINVFEGWLNGSSDESIYSQGPYNVVDRFKKSQVPFYSYINCRGGHGVIDLLNIGNEGIDNLEKKYTNFMDTVNYEKIDIDRIKNELILIELSYSFGQIMDIIDYSALFYQNKFNNNKVINSIQTAYKAKSIIKGHYFDIENCEIPLESKVRDDVNDAIKIYPNPATNRIYISFPSSMENQKVNVLCTNSIGLPIMDIYYDVYNNFLDITNLESGCYFLSFKYINNVQILKFIVCK